GRRSADQIIIAGVLEEDAVLAVSQWASAVFLRADQVPLNDVIVSLSVIEKDAIGVVAGDQVAGAQGRTAERVRRCVFEEYAVQGIAEILCPCDVSADVVALDHVAGGIVAEVDSFGPIARDNVSGCGR